MAKSIRSKWKRKTRAIKRERYAVKELARLKKTLGIKEDESAAPKEVMETEQVIFLDAGKAVNDSKKKRKLAEAEEEDVEMSSDEENLEIDSGSGEKRVFNSKTMKDQNGQYPVWLSKRKISKITKGTTKKKSKKRGKKRRY